MASADVLIQAGHEGRTSGKTGAMGPVGKEIEWTPIVADAATEHLRDAGFTVLRKTATLVGEDDVKIAIFIHFDPSRSSSEIAARRGRLAARVWARSG